MELGKLEKKGLWFKAKKDLWLVDPSSEETSLNRGEVKGVLVTKGEYGGEDAGAGVLMIRGPGEYEAGGVEIKGFSDGEAGVLATIYRIRVDGLGVVVATSFSQKWDEKRIEKLRGNDVLVVRVGDIPVKVVKNLVKKTGVNYLVLWQGEDDDSLKEYVDEFDLEGVAGQNKIKIEVESLPEGLEVVLLNG